MKANVLFQRLSRIVLMIVIMMVSFVATPNQVASAKPLSAPFINCASQTEIPEAECDALVVLYTSTNGENWTNNTDWLQTDTPCSWYGINCSAGQVYGIYLWGNNLSGVLPPEVGDLSQLVVLNLGRNHLSGTIPSEIGNLSLLYNLYLNNNQLDGSIPTSLGNLTQLGLLQLSYNHLTGSIPIQIGDMSELWGLYLNFNSLSGTIPSELGNLTQLQWLYLSNNQLIGSIPTQLGSLTQFEELSLSGNQLSGPIPAELGSLTNLTWLGLGSNQLTGSIPTELGSLTNLTGLGLGSNQLTGTIPTELGSLTNLTWLSLDNNQLSGSIPTQLGNLENLRGLALESNQLSGNIPTELGSLINLTQLTLSDNQLTGEIPATITNLTELIWFQFDQCAGLTSSDLDVIAFLNQKAPNWNVCDQNMSVQRVGSTVVIPDGDTTPSLAEGTDLGGVNIDKSQFFEFKISNSGTSVLKLTGSPIVTISGDPSFTVTAQPESSTVWNDSYWGNSFKIRFAPRSMGAHTATVSIANNDVDKNPYTFTIHGVGGKPDSYESDGDFSLARSIASDIPQTHSIYPMGDRDYVKVVLTVPSGVVFETSGANGYDTEIALYDANHTLIGYDNDGGDFLYSRLERACANYLPAGTYYLKTYVYEGVIPEYQLNFNATLCPTASIVIANNNPIAESSVDFTVTFSKPVLDVDAADFKLTNTLLTGAFVTGVTPVSASVYAVTVNTGSGNGTIRLDIPGTSSIQDFAGNAFAGPYTSGEFYTINKGAAPTVPVLKSPANGAFVAGYQPTLDWNNSSEVTVFAISGWHYEINVTSLLGYNETFSTEDDADPLAGLGASQYTFTTDLPANTTFLWKVRAYNDKNQYSAWSVTRAFRTKPMIVTTKLDKPVLRLPQDLALPDNKRPTFSWDEVSGATKYTLQILSGTRIVHVGTIKPPSHVYTPTVDLFPGTVYTWKVKANGKISSDYSDPFTFTTSSNPPKVPLLSAPANSVLLDSAAAQTLKWNPVVGVSTANAATTYPDAVSFEVEYAANSAFTGSKVEIVNGNVLALTQFSLPVGDLLPNRTYYWRVRSWSAMAAEGNHSFWSVARTFRTRLATPVLNQPENATTLDNKRPTFRWDEVPGATTYTLQILKENPKTHLFTVVAHAGTIKSPAYTYTPAVDLLPATKYTWRVKANGVNAGDYSASFTFTTSSVNPPKTPVLSAPTSGILVDSAAPQTLTWKPALEVITTNPIAAYPAALSYEIEYSANSAFDSTLAGVVTNSAVAVPQLSLPGGTFLPGRTYYWRVRSWSGAEAKGNHSAWSAARTIKVKFAAPVLDSVTVTDGSPTFVWHSANGLWANYTLLILNSTTNRVVKSFIVPAPLRTYTIPAALLPTGTYKWQVRINGLYAPISSFLSAETFNK